MYELSRILNLIESEVFYVNDIPVQPIQVIHGKSPVVGFRLGDFTYITDAKTISKESKNKIRGSKTLVVNAVREEPHYSHFNLEEALAFGAEELGEGSLGANLVGIFS